MILHAFGVQVPAPPGFHLEAGEALRQRRETSGPGTHPKRAQVQSLRTSCDGSFEGISRPYRAVNALFILAIRLYWEYSGL